MQVNGTGVGAQVPGEQSQQCGFARAVGADDRQAAAGRHRDAELDVAVGDTEMRTSLTMDVRFSDSAGGTRERTVTIPTEEFAVDADELGALLEAVWRAPADERRRVIDGWPTTTHTV